MNDLKLKFIISGILIAAIGLVLSHTYRPYVYENHINDFSSGRCYRQCHLRTCCGVILLWH